MADKMKYGSYCSEHTRKWYEEDPWYEERGPRANHTPSNSEPALELEMEVYDQISRLRSDVNYYGRMINEDHSRDTYLLKRIDELKVFLEEVHQLAAEAGRAPETLSSLKIYKEFQSRLDRENTVLETRKKYIKGTIDRYQKASQELAYLEEVYGVLPNQPITYDRAQPFSSAYTCSRSGQTHALDEVHGLDLKNETVEKPTTESAVPALPPASSVLEDLTLPDDDPTSDDEFVVREIE